jgi:hypothetical protein
MPIYCVWMNFSGTCSMLQGEETTQKIGMTFRIGTLHSKLPATGKPVCNCGCILTRKVEIKTPFELCIDFNNVKKNQVVMNYCEDLEDFYNNCRTVLSMYFDDTKDYGRNVFCWKVSKINFKSFFDYLKNDIVRQLHLLNFTWDSSKIKSFSSEFVPIQVSDPESHEINEWIQEKTLPQRKSKRLEETKS